MGRLSLPAANRFVSWSALASLPALLLVGAAAVGPIGIASAQDDEPADVAAVMLDDVGPGFTFVRDDASGGEALTRTFESDAGDLQIMGFAVTTPPGVRTLFEAFASPTLGLEAVEEPSLELGAWLVPEGMAPGEIGSAALSFASRDHLFTIFWIANTSSQIDAVPFLLELAERQVEAAGGPPAPADPELAASNDDDQELFAFLPSGPGPEHGTQFTSLRVAGADELDTAGVGVPDVAEFLNERAKNAAQVWASDRLTVAIGLTQYPYDVFAAAGLAAADDGGAPITLSPQRAAALPDAIAYRVPDDDEVGLVFRRGDILVTVLADWAAPATQDDATELALDMADATWANLPGGGTGPYEFPDPPSRVAGLLLTAGVVTLAVAGSRCIAWIRARRVRRRWATGPQPAPWAPPGAAPGTVVELDADADALRRRGKTVVVGQLISINIGIVALAGDFAWRGVIVAALSLVAGLLFSRWWLRREVTLLGPAAPSQAFVVPRLSGVLVGVVAFAVLGFGVAYFLKGVRYVIFKPTLAQLRWADLFHVAPRTVGFIFAAGGIVAVGLGGVLWRIARALGRARVNEALAADRRPPALYLRSFADDQLQLPIIASAHRPLFELFSLRGTSPFEEAVTWELKTYAPVVAVGRPGGSLASLGAAREHLPNDAWHEQIAQRMADAAVIALAPGETEGLAWELRHIIAAGHLAKTVFIFPPLPPDELDRRWRYTSTVFAEAGVPVSALPAAVALVHTARVDAGFGMRVTTAARRDEATYRTAVDRALEPQARPAPAPPPAVLTQFPSAAVP